MDPALAAAITHQRLIAPCATIDPARIRSSVMGSGTPIAAIATTTNSAGAPYCETAESNCSFIAVGCPRYAQPRQLLAAVGPSTQGPGASVRARCGVWIAGHAALAEAQ